MAEWTPTAHSASLVCSGHRAELVRFKLHLATLSQSERKNSVHRTVFRVLLVAEMGFEPHDLRVMSPASYQTAPLRDIMVPEAGVEPVRDVNLTGF